MPGPNYPPVAQSSGSLAGSILSGVPLIGGILNGVSQMFTNQANRKFQEKMYNRQRADALSDWNMQNLYNSPAEQMRRLKEAGLNPNLIYGHGADAGMGAPVRQSSASPGNAQAPRFDVSSVFQAAMLQLKDQMQAQQIENLKTQNLVLQAQIPKTIAQTENIDVDTEQKRFNLQLANATRDLDIALKSGNLKRLDVGTEIMLSENERAAARSTSDLAIAAQKILQLKLANAMNPLQRSYLEAQIRAIGLSADLRQQTKELQARGFTWSDPFYYRVGMKVLDRIVGGVNDNPLPDWSEGLQNMAGGIMNRLFNPKK